jgi:WD40 repeat protein
MGCTSSSNKKQQFSDLTSDESQINSNDSVGIKNSKYAASSQTNNKASVEAKADLISLSHTSNNASLCFSVVSNSLNSFFCGFDNGQIDYYSNWKDNKILHTYKEHDKTINRLYWNGHKNILISGSRDKLIKLWSPNQNKSLATLSAHKLVISGLACSDLDNGNELCSGSRDYSVKFWDLTSEQCVSSVEIQLNVITDIQSIPLTNNYLQTSEDLMLRIWDSRSPRQPAQHWSNDGPYFALSAAVCQENSNYIMTTHNGFDATGCNVRIRDRRVNSNEPLFDISAAIDGHAHTEAVYRGHFIGLNHFITCSKDSTIKLWQYNELTAQSRPECVQTVSVGMEYSPLCLSVAKENNSIIVSSGSSSGKLSVFSVDLQSNQVQLLARTAEEQLAK